MHTDLDVDALGLLCPLPVLRLRKRMADLPSGARVRLLADDPAALIDVPHFCAEAGHTFEGNDGHTYLIRKG
ncbi:sulfurtransferase TusA family protein [Jannaschia sp. M317]|uniref:sulfurtransferase TusA family protein n=1 Tax=Jannaschia sp. M317 TaxID=2867011 RepID=UPI0021A7E2F4|nr:sulfurtransferase TusA family protein [Jannaschia sp. M317]UWQ16869.1 sulfurtransferase TusA family protein [Jannaschia sp. M317]